MLTLFIAILFEARKDAECEGPIDYYVAVLISVLIELVDGFHPVIIKVIVEEADSVLRFLQQQRVLKVGRRIHDAF